jgi:hypothetical protein
VTLQTRAEANRKKDDICNVHEMQKKRGITFSICLFLPFFDLLIGKKIDYFFYSFD